MTAPAPSITLSRVRLAIGAVSIIAVLEIVGGLTSGSLALLSDASHLVTDSATLGLTWFAVSRSRRPAGAQNTFGYHRGGIVVAALNGAVLVLIAAAIAVGAITRLQHPTSVAAVPVLVIGLLALGGNLGIALVLRGAGGGLGVQSAALHVIADALTDAAVAVGAIALLAFGWTRADAVVSLLIATLIVVAALRLLGETLHILNEGTPRDLDAGVVSRRIAALPGIEGVHDLHVWTVTSNLPTLSAHVVIDDSCFLDGHAPQMLDELQRCLIGHFDVEHSTFQLEAAGHTEHEPGTHD